jgi:hypothetical protein
MHHRSRIESLSVYPRSTNPAKKKATRNPYEAFFLKSLNDFILLKAEGFSQGLNDPSYTLVSLETIPVYNNDVKQMLYPIRQFKNRVSSVYDGHVGKKYVNDALSGKEKERVGFEELGENGLLTVLDFVEYVRSYTHKR